MFSLTFTRVSEERERDLIRFNSFLLGGWNPNNKQQNKQIPNSKRDKRRSRRQISSLRCFTRER